MTIDTTKTYETVAAAEADILAAGYKRDTQRAMWVKDGAPHVRVIRTEWPPNKFQISSR